MNRKSRNKKRRILQQSQPVSMKALLEKLGKIAAQRGETFFRVQVDLKQTAPDRREATYQLYINGIRQIFQGNTPEQAFADLNKYLAAPAVAAPIPDAVVEGLYF